MSEDMPSLCAEDAMQAILAAAEGDSRQGLEAAEEALANFPGDPRLHFLRGSLLIGLGRLIEAHEALARAVAIAPDYAIARFQLGFFELTSGEPEAALATWAPLRALPPGHWLPSFVTGLEHLIGDRFEAGIAALREGIAANDENPPLNRDMELLIGKCEELLSARPARRDDEAEPDVSTTSFLLGLGKA